MDPQLRNRAETRLLEAAGQLALIDPRPAFRDRLKQLRNDHRAAYDRAVGHYEANILPALADGPDPLSIWVDYGAFLGGLTADGKVYRIDASGRAALFRPPAGAGELILFVPDDTAVAVLVIAEPVEPSRAQGATVDLLVSRRLGLAG